MTMRRATSESSGNVRSTKHPTSIPQSTKLSKQQQKEQREDQLMEKAIITYLDSATTPVTDSTIDEYKLFGKHVAAELKSTKNVDARRWAKLQIQTIIFNAQTGMTHSTAPTFAYPPVYPPLSQSSSRGLTPFSSFSTNFGSPPGYD